MIVYYRLNFSDPINVSCQMGDMVYYINQLTGTSGFSTGNISDLTQLGPVLAITTTSISVAFDDSLISGVCDNLTGAFIVLAKNKMINTSS